ncbi:hypothetical protein NUW58_g1236 [Xylaria curta]|uniref:Uncharacterized protein n=1 Tax=Xylaria curta TaxID=42375 RepID=A0ACC1PMW9_9PEZI|nr:hypothetical protein NUW58_g1236 [Xylaria curta]
MKVSSCLQVAMAVAVSTSPAVARVIGDGNSAKAAVTLRDLGCNKSAINACVASSGEDSSFCFRHLCPGRPIELAFSNCAYDEGDGSASRNEKAKEFKAMPYQRLTIGRSEDTHNKASRRPTATGRQLDRKAA